KIYILILLFTLIVFLIFIFEKGNFLEINSREERIEIIKNKTTIIAVNKKSTEKTHKNCNKNNKNYFCIYHPTILPLQIDKKGYFIFPKNVKKILIDVGTHMGSGLSKTVLANDDMFLIAFEPVYEYFIELQKTLNSSHGAFINAAVSE